jgi:hypothetical protein
MGSRTNFTIQMRAGVTPEMATYLHVLEESAAREASRAVGPVPLRRLHLPVVALLSACFLAYVLLLALVEAPPGGWWVPSDPEAMQVLINTLARTSVQLISTVFASLLLGIPLTSSMYTPQLIELFMRSWTNRVVLGLYVFSAAHCIWLSRLASDTALPRVHAGIGLGLVTLTLAVLPPYLFFIFRFLDPDTILERVARQAIGAMKPSGGRTLAARRERLMRSVHQIGNIALRSLERADRDVALTAVAALDRCAAAYLRVKARQPEAWFTVSADQFPGMSREALELVRRERTWVEMELLRQLARAYDAALAKAPDVVSIISRTDRHFAVSASVQGDLGGLHLAVRFFNNFLREAIKRKDLLAVYDVSYQYRLLAIRLYEAHPGLSVRIARHLDYYGGRAARMGLAFARDLAHYDLGAILAYAALFDLPEIEALVDVFLRDAPREGGPAPEPLSPGMLKARLILISSLLDQRRGELAARVEQSLRGQPASVLRIARDELLGEEVEECFWEVTDRQMNLDYLPRAQRTHVAGVLSRLEASG